MTQNHKQPSAATAASLATNSRRPCAYTGPPVMPDPWQAASHGSDCIADSLRCATRVECLPGWAKYQKTHEHAAKVPRCQPRMRNPWMYRRIPRYLDACHTHWYLLQLLIRTARQRRRRTRGRAAAPQKHQHAIARQPSQPHQEVTPAGAIKRCSLQRRSSSCVRGLDAARRTANRAERVQPAAQRPHVHVARANACACTCLHTLTANN